MTDNYREGRTTHEASSKICNKRRGNIDARFDINNDPALTFVATTSKRPRTSGRDRQDHPLQQQPPPQTRRMIDGMGCGVGGGGVDGGIVGSLSRSALFSSSSSRSRFVISTGTSTEIDLPCPAVPAASIAASLPSPLKIIERDESSMGSSRSSSSIKSGDDSVIAVIPASTKESRSVGSTQEEIDSPTSSCSSSIGSSTAGVASCGWVYTSVENKYEDVAAAVAADENELGHRMSYLEMRGYDQALLDLMDESIYEESSDDQDADNKVEMCYAPCEPIPVVAQPAVVTPER